MRLRLVLCCTAGPQRVPKSATGALLLKSVFFLVRIDCRRKEAELSDRVLTVPNIMSGIRCLLAPAIGYMTVKGFFVPALTSLRGTRE